MFPSQSRPAQIPSTCEWLSILSNSWTWMSMDDGKETVGGSEGRVQRCVKEQTDAEGWVYGTNFPTNLDSGSAKKGLQSFVRWRRM
eukprot:2650538-Amphidinium_carterae.1